MKKLLRLLTTAVLGVGLLAVTPTPAAHATGCGFTFSFSPSAGIADGTGSIVQTYTFSNSLPAGATITNLTIGATVAHANIGDIGIWATNAPDDNTPFSSLISHRGGSGDNITNAIFDDNAVTAIGAANPPFTGSYLPETPLSNIYTGQELKGFQVSLHVEDTQAGNSGVLTGWNIHVELAEHCDDDGDGDLLLGDNCPTISNADQADFDSDDIGDVCDGDIDGDGVNNTKDKCDYFSAPDTPAGCFVTYTELTLAYAKGAYKGTATPFNPLCQVTRTVKVFRLQDGKDPLIGKATSDATTGAWSLNKAKKPGKYYATVAVKTVPDSITCRQDKSPTITLR